MRHFLMRPVKNKKKRKICRMKKKPMFWKQLINMCNISMSQVIWI